MHPWGKWGRNFVEYGVVAAQAALADAGVEWNDIQFVSGADTMRNGYPGYVAGATFAQALGWKGAQVASSYAACASGVTALNDRAGPDPRRASATSRSSSAPTPRPRASSRRTKGERGDDPDWLRFRLLGATNPTYFGLYARRRMELFGATRDDFAKVKVKNARHGLANPNARYRKEVTLDDVLNAAPIVADPLRPARHLRDVSDGAAAVVLSSMEYAKSHGAGDAGARRRDLDGHAELPEHRRSSCPNFATDSAARRRGAARTRSRTRSRPRAYERGRHRPRRPRPRRGLRPLDRAGARLVREHRPLQARRGREAAAATATPRSAAAIPVNPSGGLACFGEAVPAQAIAQVCELTWQLQGQAGDRQVEGATRRAHGQPGPVRPRELRDPPHVAAPDALPAAPPSLQPVTTPTQWNLADLFEAVADAVPDRTAIVVGDRRLTFREVDERATRLAHHLAAQGVKAGDHVGLYLYNGPEYVEGLFAAYKLRAVPINVNYRYVEAELKYLFDNADLVGPRARPRVRAAHRRGARRLPEARGVRRGRGRLRARISA